MTNYHLNHAEENNVLRNKQNTVIKCVNENKDKLYNIIICLSLIIGTTNVFTIRHLVTNYFALHYWKSEKCSVVGLLFKLL